MDLSLTGKQPAIVGSLVFRHLAESPVTEASHESDGFLLNPLGNMDAYTNGSIGGLHPNSVILSEIIGGSYCWVNK